MKITVDYGEYLLKPALEAHLEHGISMQDYVRTAVSYYNNCLQRQKDGKVVGFCESDSYTVKNNYITKHPARLPGGEV